MRQEVNDPMLLPEPNHSSDRVRKPSIVLAENYFEEFDNLNERLAAQARVEAKRRKGGAA
jgi:hypothetical protein